MQDVVQRVYSIWRRLKDRFRWSFVEDETSFVDEIVGVLQTRPDPQAITDPQIDATIRQHYNQRLHQAVVVGRLHLDDDAAAEALGRACQEIHLSVVRQLRARGYDHTVAEDTAQKVVIRLIERPSRVKSPGALSVWVIWQIRDLLKPIHGPARDESLDQEERAEPSGPLAQNPIPQIDDTLFLAYVLDELPKILSPFQRQVMQLVVLEERSAVEAGAMLGVDPARVRSERARASNRIRRHIGL